MYVGSVRSICDAVVSTLETFAIMTTLVQRNSMNTCNLRAAHQKHYILETCQRQPPQLPANCGTWDMWDGSIKILGMT